MQMVLRKMPNNDILLLLFYVYALIFEINKMLNKSVQVYFFELAKLRVESAIKGYRSPRQPLKWNKS